MSYNRNANSADTVLPMRTDPIAVVYGYGYGNGNGNGNGYGNGNGDGNGIL